MNPGQPDGSFPGDHVPRSPGGDEAREEAKENDPESWAVPPDERRLCRCHPDGDLSRCLARLLRKECPGRRLGGGRCPPEAPRVPLTGWRSSAIPTTCG